MTQDQIIDNLFKDALRSKKWIQADHKIINVDKILNITKNENKSIITLIDGSSIYTNIPFSVFESYCEAGEINLNAGLMTE